MAYTQQYVISEELMDRLVALVSETQTRFLQEDEFFNEHMNLFVKSYMVLMCAYLESYLKNLTKLYIEKVDEALTISPYPKNLLRWSVQKDKYKDSPDGINDHFSLGISDDDIDRNLSANPYKTVPFFVRLGIHLNGIEEFTNLKDQVETIVNKRNSIVHYNDDASDLVASDIIENIDVLKAYMQILDSEINNGLNLLSR